MMQRSSFGLFIPGQPVSMFSGRRLHGQNYFQGKSDDFPADCSALRQSSRTKARPMFEMLDQGNSLRRIVRSLLERHF